MNDYTIYKIKIIAEKLFYKSLDFIFYIPRKLYKENTFFKTWIDKREEKSDKKRYFKEALRDVFYELDKNCSDYQENSCVIYTGYQSDDMYCLFDRTGSEFVYLLEDESWIKKNKLKVKKYTLKEYMQEFHPDRKFVVYPHNENKTVLIITR